MQHQHQHHLFCSNSYISSDILGHGCKHSIEVCWERLLQGVVYLMSTAVSHFEFIYILQFLCTVCALFFRIFCFIKFVCRRSFYTKYTEKEMFFFAPIYLDSTHSHIHTHIHNNHSFILAPLYDIWDFLFTISNTRHDDEMVMWFDGGEFLQHFFFRSRKSDDELCSLVKKMIEQLDD